MSEAGQVQRLCTATGQAAQEPLNQWVGGVFQWSLAPNLPGAEQRGALHSGSIQVRLAFNYCIMGEMVTLNAIIAQELLQRPSYASWVHECSSAVRQDTLKIKPRGRYIPRVRWFPISP